MLVEPLLELWWLGFVTALPSVGAAMRSLLLQGMRAWRRAGVAYNFNLRENGGSEGCEGREGCRGRRASIHTLEMAVTTTD